jgi:mannose-6-phosphate isomerase-like protein (cupin superfamily)
MTESVDITAVRSNWQSRGFSCDVWSDAVDEVVMVLEGKVEFDIAGRVIRPAPGEEVLIPAGTLHTVRNLGSTTSRWLYGYQGTAG